MEEQLNIYICIIQASYIGGIVYTHLSILASNSIEANNRAIVYALDRWPYTRYFGHKCEELTLLSSEMIEACGWRRE